MAGLLSLCMIVKNEAERLPQCLESIQDFVDEILITDTGSTDRTIPIAQQYGAKVTEFPWCDDFAAARNFSIQNAQGEWILVLDADEILLSPPKPDLKKLLLQKNYLAINLTRIEVGANQAPYSIVSRLFRRHCSVQFHGIYHELIDDSIREICQQESHWQIVTLESPAIAHFGYQNSEITRKNKQQFAQSLMEKHLSYYPQDSYMMSKLGGLYLSIGEQQLGMNLLQKGLTKAIDAANIYELHYHLADGYCQQQNFGAAEQAYHRALQQHVPEIVKLSAYFNLASLYLNCQEYDAAISYYQKVLGIDASFALAFYNLGIAYKQTGALKRARESYEQALTIDPQMANAYRNLGVVLFKLGAIVESKIAFQQAITSYQNQNNLAEAQYLQQQLQSLKLI